jgi:hypothetical protein
MKIITKRVIFLIVFLFLFFSTIYAQNEYFICNHQLQQMQTQHEIFAQYSTYSEMIRRIKKERVDISGNVMLVALYIKYVDGFTRHVLIPKVFLSGWNRTENSLLLEDFDTFLLSSAYPACRSTFKKRKIAETEEKKEEESPRNNEDLVTDFKERNITVSSNKRFDSLNLAHTEQAFFSYIKRGDLSSLLLAIQHGVEPDAILINMISYLPLCSGGGCLKTMKALLHNNEEENQFREVFICKLFPDIPSTKNVKINILYTIVNLTSLENADDLLNGNNTFCRMYN